MTESSLWKNTPFKVAGLDVDPARLTLTSAAGQSTIEPKVMDLLQVLVSRVGETISRNALIDDVWGVHFGGDESLTRAVYLLRKALSVPHGVKGVLRTIPKRGYVLEAPVSLQAATRKATKLPSIAVLPFVDLVGDETQYFADGVMVEIISALSQYRSLFVIGSGTSLSLRNAPHTPKQTAEALDVDYVLNGNVRKAAQSVRILVELHDRNKLSPLWSRKFEGAVDDVFEFQERIASVVASKIEPSIVAAEVDRARRRGPKELASYDAYLRGLHRYWDDWDTEALTEAGDYFEQAMQLDPSFAPAQAYLSNTLANLSLIERRSADASRKRAIDLAHNAAKLAPEDAEVLAVSAGALMHTRDTIETIDELISKSLTLNPVSSVARQVSGWINVFAGRTANALKDFRTAQELDPRSPWDATIVCGIGYSFFFLKEFQRAIPPLQKASREIPSRRWAIDRLLASCYLNLGDNEAAKQFSAARDPTNRLEQKHIEQFLAAEDRTLYRESLRQLALL